LQIALRWAINVSMKWLITVFLLLGLTVPALAINRSQLDQRIRKLTAEFEEMQAKPDKRIPAESLRRAQGIILLDRTKAGFIFAFQGGSGVAMVKDAKTGQWSSPAFVRADEASLGFLIGGQHSFVAILLMNTNTTQELIGSSFDFGGEASGTAGNTSGKAEGTVSSNNQAVVQVYTDSSGLYGGAAIKGGAISTDTDANVAYYGQSLTPKEILFEHKGKPSDAATYLARQITLAAK
jgi:lipid-binding SYLF domain-containing protein